MKNDPLWIAHSNALNAGFSQLDQRQLNNIRRAGEPSSSRRQPESPSSCLYFFSGPDFLYADTLYPIVRPVLVSLEPIESIPELQTVPPAFLGEFSASGDKRLAEHVRSIRLLRSTRAYADIWSTPNSRASFQLYSSSLLVRGRRF